MVFVDVYDADTNKHLGSFDVEFDSDWDIVEKFEDQMVAQGHRIISLNHFQGED